MLLTAAGGDASGVIAEHKPLLSAVALQFSGRLAGGAVGVGSPTDGCEFTDGG